MAYPSPFARLFNYLQQGQAGMVFDADFWSDLDAELDNIVTSLGQQLTVLRGITSASGRLVANSDATAMSLVATERIVAGSGGQTVFTTTIPWDSAFTTYNVIISHVPVGTYYGSALDPNQFSVAENAGFLEVTILPTTMVIGDIMVISAFTAGAGVLTRLASSANGDGASLVSIEEDGPYAAVDVQGALVEIRTLFDALTSALGTTSNIWYKTGKLADGTTPAAASGNWAMATHKITGLGNGVDNQDAVTVAQLLAATQGFSTLTSFFLRKDVAVPWESDQDANGHKLANLVMTSALGTSSEAANKNYVDGAITAQVGPLDTRVTALEAGTTGATTRFTRFLNYDTAQTNTSWQVPVNITLIIVEIWGGGAGGAPGAAGGAGGYAKVYLTTTPLESLLLTVGQKGAGHASVIQAGGDSYITRSASDLVRAAGGAISTGNGGTATISSGSGETITGGDGAALNASGGYGGNAGRGGSGGANRSGFIGTTGKAPGGGGGAGTVSATIGGDGGVGRITITY